MFEEFSRTELLIGRQALEKLSKSRVAIFGIGGVGSFVVEGLARGGIGNFVLVDSDNVHITNINRQIIATHNTLGRPKVEVAKKRILEINPNAQVEIYNAFYSSDNSAQLIQKDYNYVVDAIDSVSSKINLILKSKEMNIPIISCMGMGNKLDPTMIEVTDIYKTSICPLSKIIRKEMRKNGINSLKVVFSKEKPVRVLDKFNSKRQIPGSVSFVPSVAGLIIAGEVIKDLIKSWIVMEWH